MIPPPVLRSRALPRRHRCLLRFARRRRNRSRRYRILAVLGLLLLLLPIVFYGILKCGGFFRHEIASGSIQEIPGSDPIGDAPAVGRGSAAALRDHRPRRSHPADVSRLGCGDFRRRVRRYPGDPRQRPAPHRPAEPARQGPGDSRGGRRPADAGRLALGRTDRSALDSKRCIAGDRRGSTSSAAPRKRMPFCRLRCSSCDGPPCGWRIAASFIAAPGRRCGSKTLLRSARCGTVCCIVPRALPSIALPAGLSTCWSIIACSRAFQASPFIKRPRRPKPSWNCGITRWCSMRRSACTWYRRSANRARATGGPSSMSPLRETCSIPTPPC